MPDPERLPKYRHYKPKNLAVVRINGRDVYLGRYDSPESREKYRRVVAEWLTGGGVIPPPSLAVDPDADALTVGQLILAFWRFAETHYRHADGTNTGELEGYRLTLRPLRELYGST